MDKKRFEFSKLMVVVSNIMGIGVILFSCFMSYKFSDTTVLMYLIPSSFALLSSTNIFYYRKSSEENKIKIARTVKDEQLDTAIIVNQNNETF